MENSKGRDVAPLPTRPLDYHTLNVAIDALTEAKCYTRLGRLEDATAQLWKAIDALRKVATP